MLYAKMIDDKNYEFAPMNHDGYLNFNKDEDLMKQYGYKPFIKAELPNNDRKYKIVYQEDISKITEKIEYLESEDEYNKRVYYDNKKNFEDNFFYLPTIRNDKNLIVFRGGYYRKKPKGYQSAIESINTAANVVKYTGELKENTLTFYNKPNFYETDCLEDNKLLENQFKNNRMNADDFNLFYICFVTAWNDKNHL